MKVSKIKRIAGVVVGTTALFGVAVAPASAINDIKNFGVQETLKNYVNLGDFNSEIGYTVRDLKPSGDAVPYPVAGRLYEANVTTDAVVGTVFPQPNNFIARTPGGGDYRALPVSGLGGPLGPGASAPGKLYFDVVGENPDSVIYNDQAQDLLGWVGPQPISPGEVVPGTMSGGGNSSGGNASEGSTGPMQATPPITGGDAGDGTGGSNGAQNGPYGPAGGTPPVGSG